MKKNAYFLFAFLFFSLTNQMFSQDKQSLGHNEFFAMHYYTFEGNATQDKLDAMEAALAKISMVSEAKVKFKFEKNMGQIILVVKEKTITSEGDKSFSPTDIKQTILNHGFVPKEYTTGTYDRK